jgi:hypothetical protein
MNDIDESTTVLDKKADQVLEEIGLDPDASPEEFTFESGCNFGQRFAELLAQDQTAIDELFREVLKEFEGIFPGDPLPQTIEFQAYLLGPLVSLLLTGRGLTIPEMATLAGVTREHAYRLNRNGLAIIFKQQAPPVRPGVNRRFSGRDDRATYHLLNTQGLAEKPWPAPVEEVRPFLLGVMKGLQESLERPKVRSELEPRFKQALSNLLRDPSLGDLMDGVVLALDRIAQGLRDTPPGRPGPILRMKAEREKAIEFQAMLAEISRQRPAILAELSKVGSELGGGLVDPRPDPFLKPRQPVRRGIGRGASEEAASAKRPS